MKKKLFFGIAAVLAVLFFMSCPEEKKETIPGFKLTVTNKDSNWSSSIKGASLMPEKTSGQPDVIAMGVGMGGNGVYIFYYPNASKNYPNFSAPFRETGNWAVGLSAVDGSYNPTDSYVYKLNDTGTDWKVTVDGDFSLPWSGFVKVPPSPPGP